MTAEEKLKELYGCFMVENYEIPMLTSPSDSNALLVDVYGKARLSPMDIDLIANLVIERMKKEEAV